jgi:hypothetical protein
LPHDVDFALVPENGHFVHLRPRLLLDTPEYRRYDEQGDNLQSSSGFYHL